MALGRSCAHRRGRRGNRAARIRSTRCSSYARTRFTGPPRWPALFAAFVIVLFGFIYLKIDDYLIARSDRMITTQVNFIAALPPDRRIGAIDDHLGQDSRGVQFAGIFDAKGHRLAGNIARLPGDLASRCGR